MANKNIKIFYFLAAIIAFWFWHVDEHFQIFEYAAYKLGMTAREDLAWEFGYKMRSGIMPFLVYLASKFFILINLFHPYIIGVIFRILSAGFFIFVYFRLIEKFDINPKSIEFKFVKWFWILPIVMIRFTPEVIAGCLFWLGFLRFESENKSKKSLLIIGLLWGIGFYLRMHIAILIGVTLLYHLIYRRVSIVSLAYIFIGFIGSTMLEFLSNYWLYGEWIWSPYQYFIQNIVEDKAASFGLEPFYYYLTELINKFILPIGLVVVLGLISYLYRNIKSIYAWLIIGFVLIHSVVGHKEFRFLFPIFPLLIIVSFVELARFKEISYYNVILKSLLYLNFLLLPLSFIIQSFRPLNWLYLYQTSLSEKTIYSDLPSPYALDTRFPHVKPYFFKSKNCVVQEISLKNDSVAFESNSIVISKEKLSRLNYVKQWQTIPDWINDKLPLSVKETIDYCYVYRVK